MRFSACVLALSVGLSTPLAAQSAWTVEARPILELPTTGADGSVLYTTASWAAALRDGSIAVVDGPEGKLLVFGRDGSLRRSIGRRGGGPGEFRDLVWVGQCAADSLYAWDAMTSRMTVIGLDGSVGRQFAIAGSQSSRQAACGAGGRAAVFSVPDQTGPREAEEKGSTSGGGQYEVHRMRASVLVADREGAETARVAGVRWADVIIGTLGPGGGRGALPRPLGGRTLFAFAGDAVVVAESDSARVRWYGFDGSLRAQVTLPRPTRAPSAEEYERAIAPAMVGAPAAMLETIEAFAKSAPPPALLPALSGLAVDPQGLAWVVTSPDGAPRTQLRVLHSDGRTVATLDIAATLTVFAVTEDLILGRRENADGEQVVVGYRLNRR